MIKKGRAIPDRIGRKKIDSKKGLTSRRKKKMNKLELNLIKTKARKEMNMNSYNCISNVERKISIDVTNLKCTPNSRFYVKETLTGRPNRTNILEYDITVIFYWY